MQKFITNLAQKAGKILLKDFEKLRRKSPNQKLLDKRVTPSDLKSEKFILSELARRFPKDNILSEEAGFLNKKSKFTWIVDPLDGTRNFSRANPLFAVAITLLEKKKGPILTAIFAPFLKELFWAELGKGIFLNGRKIKVSTIDELKKARFFICPGGEKNCSKITQIYQKFIFATSEIRKLGSATIETSWVATGRAEGFVALKANPWDVASGVLLVQEAGGKVTDFQGNPWNWQKHQDLIFSNSRVHQKILKLIRLKNGELFSGSCWCCL